MDSKSFLDSCLRALPTATAANLGSPSGLANPGFAASPVVGVLWAALGRATREAPLLFAREALPGPRAQPPAPFA